MANGPVQIMRAAAQRLAGMDDVALRPGAGATVIESFEREAGFALPPGHAQVLGFSNGAEAYAGYLRLFGLGAAEGIDALRWNRDDWWKFAWGSRCSDFWCFAETAWGDQYAYSISSLRAGRGGEVYMLDAMSMTPRTVASSFAEFFDKEFLRSAREPYDDMTRHARARFGPLDADLHLVYVPSLLLGGTKDITQVTRMPARAAMVVNGDLAMQLDAAPPGSAVEALLPHEDEQHRMRMRVIWAGRVCIDPNLTPSS